MARTPSVAKFLRLPVPLARRLEALARAERRTFTAQVLLMLEEWVQAQPPAAPTQCAAPQSADS